MTDLKTVPDHPAGVLSSHAEAMTRSISATTAERMATFRAADVLRAYEADRGVTFAALDNKALAAVREAYEVVTFYDDAFESAGRDFKNAVRDLLGLDD